MTRQARKRNESSAAARAAASGAAAARAAAAHQTEGDPRWEPTRARDASADGAFVYAVTTTGVYCRPSCRARLARPEHVRFFSTPAAAEHSGYRPCKRCQPNKPPVPERKAALVAELCRLIDASEQPLRLSDLASATKLSVFHLHRLFREVTGLTPRGYANARRADRLRNVLAHAPSVTAAIYEAGYQSSGPAYASSEARLGMTPSAYRSGGRGEEVRFGVGTCSLGAILVAATRRGVCAIALGDDPKQLVHDLTARFPQARLAKDPAFASWLSRAVALVEQPTKTADRLPLDLRGTVFQERVWKALQQIPPGKTTTYSDLARAVGAPAAARAVASACAHNPLAVAIPCHRVVGKTGALCGYRWGVERKIALLTRECAITTTPNSDRGEIRLGVEEAPPRPGGVPRNGRS